MLVSVCELAIVCNGIMLHFLLLLKVMGWQFTVAWIGGSHDLNSVIEHISRV